MELDSILESRGKTHGSFSDHAMVEASLMAVVDWDKLTMVQRAGMRMILHKIARIIVGDPNHVDHWVDVAGYATLVAKDIGAGK